MYFLVSSSETIWLTFLFGAAVENDYAPPVSAARMLIGWGPLSDTYIVSPYDRLGKQEEASALVVQKTTINPQKLVVFGPFSQPNTTTDLQRPDAYTCNLPHEPQWKYVHDSFSAICWC